MAVLAKQGFNRVNLLEEAMKRAFEKVPVSSL
jgi:hypothetical protein